MARRRGTDAKIKGPKVPATERVLGRAASAVGPWRTVMIEMVGEIRAAAVASIPQGARIASCVATVRVGAICYFASVRLS